MQRLAFGLIVAIALTLAARDFPSSKPAQAQADVTVMVTSAADELAGAECPHAELCTLRAAITFVNADLSEDTLAIEFDAVVFPIAAPTTITIATTSLPAITRSDVRIDARSAGVLLEGTAGVDRGLQVFGDRVVVLGLAIHGFTLSCLEVAGTALQVGGDSTTGEGNMVGRCDTGILAGGTDAIVAGNVVGFDVDGAPASVETGVRIVGDGAIVGGEEPGQSNVIGNASTAIHVDFVLAGVVRVVGNTIGQADGGTAAPVSVGILVDRAVPGPEITSNLISNAGTGISVPETAQGSSIAVAMRNNTFEALGGLAIDLAGDGIRNENDPGDGDIGANDRLNHPTITRAARTEISGTAGTSCGSCTIDLVLAAHTPGGANDHGSFPLATTMAAADGSFSFAAPTVSAGDWITAAATDAGGNTSEFGPSARVGAGQVQCGPLDFDPGWNHAGFFGAASLPLGDSLPGIPQGSIPAAYQLDPASQSYRHWIADGPSGNTLTLLSPGAPYWFLVAGTVSLGTGFSATVPFPVALAAGWNDFVYLGAGADVRDALGAIDGKYSSLHRFEDDGDGGRWLSYLPGQPLWVQDFGEVEACGAYRIWMNEAATLVPLQP